MLINTEPKPNIRLALKVSDLSVGAWYDRRSLKTDKCKPGPKSVYSDVEVLHALRKYIAEPIFYLEGYKKLKVRLKEEYGIDVGKERPGKQRPACSGWKTGERKYHPVAC